MRNLFGQDPYLLQLQKLLLSYRRVAEESPLQKSSLSRLGIEQSGIEKEELSKAGAFLEESIKFSEAQKPSRAKFFFREAYEEVRRLVSKASLKGEATPADILEEALSEENHTLALSLNLLEAGGDENLLPYVKNAQIQVLSEISTFIDTVLIHEKREYPKFCQKEPWEEVIPLFDKGLTAAKRSLENLDKMEGLPLATKLQQETIKSWQQALEILQKAPIEAKSCLEEKTAEGESLQEVLRLLMNMEQDDETLRVQEGKLQRGLKPW
jgi:hypothetical protein